MEIQHFSHNHPLNLVDQVEVFGPCQGCDQIVLTRNTPSYKCLKFGCWFHIHKPCAELPQQLSHPFHPQHPLTLLPHPPSNCSEFRCQACGKTRRGFTFHCSTCQFNLDINCANPKLTNRLASNILATQIFIPWISAIRTRTSMFFALRVSHNFRIMIRSTFALNANCCCINHALNYHRRSITTRFTHNTHSFYALKSHHGRVSRDARRVGRIIVLASITAVWNASSFWGVNALF
ncbi:unnamed protein product [Camellia sinensis]